ncbi:MAG: efflux RND transporter permease subunit [Planctomycetaceae bacterium]|nr:efflux RND transporter permease subunit [Planctomycetaceae bacterium]
MDIIRFSIENPVKVAVGVILIVLFGVIALNTVPIQLTPDVDRPVVTVRTEWPGRSPEEIEKSILIEQEEKLKTVQGLWKMVSTADLGRANITLEFNVGVEMMRALQEVANTLDEVPYYPEDVDRPVIRAADTASDDAVAYCLLQADDPEFEMAEFYDHADRYLKPALERIPGVAELTIHGGREHQVQVQFDPATLAQRGISVTQLRAALQSDNVNESAGDLADGRQDVRFRVLGQFDSLDPLRRTIITYDAHGVPIRVEDVADVDLTLEKKVYFNQCKGRTSMSIFIKRETGTNVLEVMKGVRRQIDELNAPGGLLKSYKNDRYGINLRLIVDDTYYINRAVGLVRENLLLGGCLAVLILLLFLRSPRPTLIIAVAIPISVMGTFVVMALTGRNLNVISLAGLSFAVGMVVDNAIVVLENIDRHLAMGEKAFEAAYRGAKEVWGAILSSTLTTIAVFAPVLTIQEESGQLFYDIALAICAAVALSLIVSITVVPTAGSKFLRDHRKHRGPIRRAAGSLFGLVPLSSWCCDAFSRLIYLICHPNLAGVWLRLVLVSLITVAALGLSWMLVPPASYLPDGNKNHTFGQMFTPPGYSLSQNTLVAERLEAAVRPYWEAKDSREATAIAPLIDSQTNKPIEVVPAIDEFFFVVSRGRVFMITTSKDPENVKPVKAILDQAMKRIPGCRGYASQRSIFGRNAGGSNTVEVEVVGNDMQQLVDSSSQLQQALMAEFSGIAVRNDPMTFNEAGPEQQLIVDQVRAKELGLNVGDMAITARAMVDGAKVGDFNFDGDNIDLVIVRDPNSPLTPHEMAALPLAVTEEDGRHAIVPLGDLVQFVDADASQSIRRVEQRRAVTFTVNPPAEMALEQAQARIEELVAGLRQQGLMASEVEVNMSGNADKLTQVRTALLGHWTGWNWESVTSVGLSRLFLALVITYLLMAALFESFLYPFVIMFSVPLAAVGGFVGLRLVRILEPAQQLDTLTMLGFVILIGVVVNNAILIVHQALNFMRGIGEGEHDICEKLPPREAIRQSVKTRIRPIFMTTATSVFGMLPLVLAPGAGSELYRGLGAVVVGGLVCSTIFTLLVVPLLFSLVLDCQAGLGRLFSSRLPALVPGGQLALPENGNGSADTLVAANFQESEKKSAKTSRVG